MPTLLAGGHAPAEMSLALSVALRARLLDPAAI